MDLAFELGYAAASTWAVAKSDGAWRVVLVAGGEVAVELEVVAALDADDDRCEEFAARHMAGMLSGVEAGAVPVVDLRPEPAPEVAP